MITEAWSADIETLFDQGEGILLIRGPTKPAHSGKTMQHLGYCPIQLM
jgi:hypothetical protein